VLERSAVGRALNDAVLLAPAVAGNGPSGNIMMAGASSPSKASTIVNGVVVNENLRRAGAESLHRGRDPGDEGVTGGPSPPSTDSFGAAW